MNRLQFVAIIVAMLFTGTAEASLVLDLQAESLSGSGTILTSKYVSPSLGDVITIGIYAYNNDDNGVADDYIKLVVGGLLSNPTANSVKGDISKFAAASPFNSLGSTGGTLSTDSYGNTYIALSSTAGWSARTGTSVDGDPIGSSQATETLLGTFTYTVTSLGNGLYGETVNAADPISGNYGVIKLNGVTYSNLTTPRAGGMIDVGAPIYIGALGSSIEEVPEPGTFVLLGLSGLAFLFFRRK
jgi:hypothetical protein